MPQLWLVPTDEASFKETLARPRDLTAAPDKPDAFPDEARVWGVRTDPEQGSWERNTRNLERMAPEDPLLVYRNGESQYVAAGRIGGPFWHTEWVRDTFWNGGPALDVFHITDWTQLTLDPATVNRILDYKRGYIPQGLSRVTADRPTDQLLRHIGLK